MGSQECFRGVEGITQGRSRHTGKASRDKTLERDKRFAGFKRVGVGVLMTKAKDETLQPFKSDKLNALCGSDFQAVCCIAFEKTTETFREEEKT